MRVVQIDSDGGFHKLDKLQVPAGPDRYVLPDSGKNASMHTLEDVMIGSKPHELCVCCDENGGRFKPLFNVPRIGRAEFFEPGPLIALSTLSDLSLIIVKRYELQIDATCVQLTGQELWRGEHIEEIPWALSWLNDAVYALATKAKAAARGDLTGVYYAME